MDRSTNSFSAFKLSLCVEYHLKSFNFVYIVHPRYCSVKMGCKKPCKQILSHLTCIRLLFSYFKCLQVSLGFRKKTEDEENV